MRRWTRSGTAAAKCTLSATPTFSPAPTPRALGPSRRLLNTLRDGPHTLVLSPALFDELERVLGYPRLRKRWATTPDRIQDYLRDLEALALVVTPAQGPPIVPGDPDDDMILYTALAGNAEVICTWDHDFQQSEVLQFCQRRGIRILTDSQLLEEL